MSRSGELNDQVEPVAKCYRLRSSASGSWPSISAKLSRRRGRDLVGSLFTISRYDLADPLECISEYRVELGPSRSIARIDSPSFRNGHPFFVVEARSTAESK